MFFRKYDVTTSKTVHVHRIVAPQQQDNSKRLFAKPFNKNVDDISKIICIAQIRLKRRKRHHIEGTGKLTPTNLK